MDTPPKQMSVNLEDNDINNDMNAIIAAMAKIRAEASTDKGISDKQKDEYLHLTYRLACGIKATADETTLTRMQKIASTLDRNPKLMAYDPRQDGFWKQKESAFIKTLDTLLISTEGDRFSSIDDKHHILQAIKYLAAGETLEEKERIYDSIVPFNGGILENAKSNFFTRVLGNLFGKNIQVESIDQLVLKSDSGAETLDELKQIAKDRGYTKLRIKIPQDERREFERKNSNTQVIGVIENNQNESLREPSQLPRKALKFLTYATFPISGYILGSLGGEKNAKFWSYLNQNPDYNNTTQRGWCNVFSVLGNAAGAVAAGFYAAQDDVTGAKAIAFGLLSTYLGIEQVVRFGYGVEHEELLPTIPGELITLPFENIKKKDPKRNLEVEINLGNDFEITKDESKELTYFEKACEQEVPEEIERNLTWNEMNHHNFGKEFLEYMAKSLPSSAGLAINLDKKKQRISYSSVKQLGEYTKTNQLVCKSGKRYLLTAITSGTNPISEQILDELTSEGSSIEKIRKARSSRGISYLHLREYAGNKLIYDEAI